MNEVQSPLEEAEKQGRNRKWRTVIVVVIIASVALFAGIHGYERLIQGGVEQRISHARSVALKFISEKWQTDAEKMVGQGELIIALKNQGSDGEYEFTIEKAPDVKAEQVGGNQSFPIFITVRNGVVITFL